MAYSQAMIMNINDFFSTHDLGLVAALVSVSFPIDHLDKNNPGKVEFFFKREEGLDEAVQSYWSNSMRVSPLMFFNNVKTIKNRIYSE